MGGWYNPQGLYIAEELGGLPRKRFAEALTAEGVPTGGTYYNPVSAPRPVVSTQNSYLPRAYTPKGENGVVSN